MPHGEPKPPLECDHCGVRSTEVRRDPATVSTEAREFARCEHLSDALRTAIDLVNEHFTPAGSLSVSLEFDPEEMDTPHLVIHAPVNGDPIEVAESHWQFSLSAATALGIQRGRINLVFDIR